MPPSLEVQLGGCLLSKFVPSEPDSRSEAVCVQEPSMAFKEWKVDFLGLLVGSVFGI